MHNSCLKIGFLLTRGAGQVALATTVSKLSSATDHGWPCQWASNYDRGLVTCLVNVFKIASASWIDDHGHYGGVRSSRSHWLWQPYIIDLVTRSVGVVYNVTSPVGWAVLFCIVLHQARTCKQQRVILNDAILSSCDNEYGKDRVSRDGGQQKLVRKKPQ